MSVVGDPLNTTDPGHITKIIFMALVSIAIIISNIVNMIVLKRFTQINKVGRIFLFNLSVADFLVGVVVGLPGVISAAVGDWIFSEVICQVAGVLHGTTAAVSIWSLSIVSVERYVAVLHPLKYRNQLSMKACAAILVFVWLVPLVTFLIPVMGDSTHYYYKYSSSTLLCGMYWDYAWLCIVTGVMIPVLSGTVLLYTTVRIARALGAMKKVLNAGKSKSKAAERASSRDNKAVLVLAVTAISYFTAWTPYVIVVFVDAFGRPYISAPSLLIFLTMWLANCNSFINVIIYSTLYDGFRRATKSLFMNILCCPRCNNRVTAEPSTDLEHTVTAH